MKTLRIFASGAGKVGRERPYNYGDNLMEALLRGLYDTDPVYVAREAAELIGVGSILDAHHRATRKKRWSILKKRPWQVLHVWGSGFMNSDGLARWPQRLAVHAVRGPLSAAKLGRPDLVQGDPALLLPRVWPRRGTPLHAVAVVPHFALHAEMREAFGARLPANWTLVDLVGDPHAITETLFRSEIVLSSSLHGLILADAYGIPALRLAGDAQRIKGGGFKYDDYAAYRGAPFNAPIELEDVLRDPQAALAAAPTPCTPSSERLDALTAAFPFR